METQNWEGNTISSNSLALESTDSVHRVSRKTSLVQSSGGQTNHAFQALEMEPSFAEPPFSATATTSLGEEFAVEIEKVMESLKVKSDDTRIQAMLVNTGEMSVNVRIGDKLIFQAKLDEIVNDMGRGYYQQKNFRSESDQQDDSRSEYLEATIRVRHEQFEEVIQSIKGSSASVNYIHSNSYDVAGDYVDATARSAVLDALRSSLQILMRKAQSIEEVLMLHREINRLMEEAESQRQRATLLQNQSKYSTLTLHIRYFTPSNKSNSTGKWNPFSSITSALHDAGVVLISIVDGVIYVVFWLLPFFLILAGIGFCADNPDYKKVEFSPKDPTESKNVV